MVVTRNFQNRAELRKKPRRHFHYNARIFTAEKAPLLPCALADISESGARLTLKNDAELPQQFMLVLTKAGEARRRCRVVWRDGLTLGVEFPTPRR